MIAASGEPAPDDPLRYVPTTTPGVRLPSVPLGRDASSYDQLGPWFTLLNADPDQANAFADAAARLKVPLALAKPFGSDSAREVLGKDLLLVRPDTMIAWRGMPNIRHNPAAVLARATGHAVS